MSEENGASDGEEKSHEPTPRKLEEARKKGNIAKSSDVNVAAAYFGFLLAIGAGGAIVMNTGGIHLKAMFEFAPELAQDAMQGGGGRISKVLGWAALGLLPLVGFPMIAALASVLAQRSMVFAPDKLKPKASRINPIEVAKGKFGLSGLFEFGKSFVKLVVYGLVLGIFLYADRDALIGSFSLSPRGVAWLMMDRLGDFLLLIALIALVIGGIDFLFQVYNHRQKLMMTRKELMDETKQAEGDPHMKQQRRQKGVDIAMNSMLADVPKADVIMVNPTHYAVALKWDRSQPRAPILLAKGMDEIAARIRDVAAENAIPVHSDPPATRAIYATVDIGQEIRPDHYKAVAAAIRFADRMRKLAGGKS